MTLTISRPVENAVLTPTPTEVPTRTGPDILRAAKRYIEEHGWYQGDFEDADGKVCMSGALHRVCPQEARAEGGYSVALVALNDLCGYPPSFNDEPNRTIEEVYAAFDRAIAIAEQR